GLQDLAYTEGKNIILEFRSTEPPEVRLPDLVAELVRLPVDVIVAGGTSAVLAARQATTTSPIVGLSVEPVARGLVATLATSAGVSRRGPPGRPRPSSCGPRRCTT